MAEVETLQSLVGKHLGTALALGELALLAASDFILD